MTRSCSIANDTTTYRYRIVSYLRYYPWTSRDMTAVSWPRQVFFAIRKHFRPTDRYLNIHLRTLCIEPC